MQFYFLGPTVLYTDVPKKTTKLEVRDGDGGDENEGQDLLGEGRIWTVLYYFGHFVISLPYLNF